jgi:hypothetical protein
LHPVLSKYLLKLDINNQPLDYDHDIPKEELDSPAGRPPVLSLKLENHQGYLQLINIQASSDSPDVGVTVRDVLRAIHEDARKLSPRHEWTKLNAKERKAIDATFLDSCKTEEELGHGPRRVDYLRGRDKLQILSKLPRDGWKCPPILRPQNLCGLTGFLERLLAHLFNSPQRLN